MRRTGLIVALGGCAWIPESEFDLDFDTAPRPFIESPDDGSVLNEGEPIAFSGRVEDRGDDVTALVCRVSESGSVLAEAPPESDGTFAAALDLPPGPHALAFACVDENGRSGEATASITVNRLPGEPTVRLTPDPPTSADEILAFVEASDPDGDPLSFRFTWYVDDVAMDWQGGNVPAGEVRREEVLRVVVVVFDGHGESDPGEDSAVVANAPPAITEVRVETRDGEDVGTDSVLEALPFLSDADDDAASVTYRWLVNDRDIGQTSNTLAGVDWFDRDDTVVVEATPSDDFEVGQPTRSDVVVVRNTPPEVVVAFSPSRPREGDDSLVCAPSVRDPDGDSTTVSLAWAVDRGDWDGSTGTTSLPGDTIDGAWLTRDANWTCTPTSIDTRDAATTTSATTEVAAAYSGWGGATVDLASTATRWTLTEGDSYSGVAQCGQDLDGDGLGDLAYSSVVSSGGRIDILSGGQLAVEGVFALADAEWSIRLATAGALGDQLGCGTDTDSDGAPDLLVTEQDTPASDGGASGGGLTVLSGAGITSGAVRATSDASVFLVGSAEYGKIGGSLLLGDIGGDGLDDIVVGAAGWAEYTGVPGTGAIWVVDGTSLTAGVSEIDSVATVQILGSSTGSPFFGWSLALFDSSGQGDQVLAASAPQQAGSGVVWLFESAALDGSDPVLLDREATGSIAAAEGDSGIGATMVVGDMDADGLDDLGIGSTYAANSTGTVWWMTNPDPLAATTTDDAWAAWNGAPDAAWFGAPLIAVDVDDDLRPDILSGGLTSEWGAALVLGSSAQAGESAQADLAEAWFGGVRTQRFGSVPDVDGNGLPELVFVTPESVPEAGAWIVRVR